MRVGVIVGETPFSLILFYLPLSFYYIIKAKAIILYFYRHVNKAFNEPKLKGWRLNLSQKKLELEWQKDKKLRINFILILAFLSVLEMHLKNDLISNKHGSNSAYMTLLEVG